MAYDRRLKADANLSRGQVVLHGLSGMCINIVQAARDMDTRAATGAYDTSFAGRTFQCICVAIQRLLASFQQMLSIELDAVPERIVSTNLRRLHNDTPLLLCTPLLVTPSPRAPT